MVDRLKGPRWPKLLIDRKRSERNDRMPRCPSSKAAMLVAMLLYDRDKKGMTKAQLMAHAESNGIRDKSIYEVNNRYDGFHGMGDLIKGDPSLVVGKGKRGAGYLYCLSTYGLGKSEDLSGESGAVAYHDYAHQLNPVLCKCGSMGRTYNERDRPVDGNLRSKRGDDPNRG